MLVGKICDVYRIDCNNKGIFYSYILTYIIFNNYANYFDAFSFSFITY